LGSSKSLYAYSANLDLLAWRNLGTAAAKLTTAYITTIGDSTTGRATNLYSSNGDITALIGSTVNVTGQVQAAQIGVVTSTAGSYYNLTTVQVAIGAGGTSYGSGWAHYSSGDSEKLYWTRAGNLVLVFGWCKKASSSGGGATIATGLPAAVVDTVAGVRSSSSPALGGGGNVVNLSSYGGMTFLYNTGGVSEPVAVDLIINFAYRHNGLNTNLF
jgi:hypothetical protein